MHKKSILFFVIIFLFNANILARAENAQVMADKYHNIQEEMLSKPDLVTPDSIYTTAELKAIYYQNAQIIGLLEEIKELLRLDLERNE